MSQTGKQLISAARDGDVATVRYLVTEGHVDVNVTDELPKATPPLLPKEEGATGDRCAPIGGYDDVIVVRAAKLGGVATGDKMKPSAVTTNTQQVTYAIPDRTKKQTSPSPPPLPPSPSPPKEEGATGDRCAPIGVYDDVIVVRTANLGGVASGNRMKPSAVTTNTQQSTYAIPDRTKKALSMADTPPPLPAPLKEGDEGPPVGIYALCGPASDDREMGVASGCGPAAGDRESGLATSYEAQCLLHLGGDGVKLKHVDTTSSRTGSLNCEDADLSPESVEPVPPPLPGAQPSQTSAAAIANGTESNNSAPFEDCSSAQTAALAHQVTSV